MDIKAFLDTVLFSIGENHIRIGQIVSYFALLLLLYLGKRMVEKRWLPKYFQRNQLELQQRKRVLRNTSFIFILLAFLVAVLLFRVDYVLFGMFINDKDAPICNRFY